MSMSETPLLASPLTRRALFGRAAGAATTADAGNSEVKAEAPADSDLEDEGGDEFDKPVTGKKRASKQAEGQRVRTHK